VMARDGADCEEVIAQFGKQGVNVDELAARLQEEGAKSFTDSWHELMKVIESKSMVLTQGA
jgi:transaldolase